MGNYTMKIKALSRPSSSAQAPGTSAQKAPRNLDPALHPFARSREYTRALNATKLERMFAAPFIAQLGKGHVDGVYTLAKDPNSLERFASGSGDGIVKVWDLTSRDEIWHTSAHENLVKGMCWTQDRKLLTCASDRSVKLWSPYDTQPDSAPTATWLGTNASQAYHTIVRKLRLQSLRMSSRFTIWRNRTPHQKSLDGQQLQIQSRMSPSILSKPLSLDQPQQTDLLFCTTYGHQCLSPGLS